MFRPWPEGILKDVVGSWAPLYSTAILTGWSPVLATKAAKQEPLAALMSSLLTA
jgi:hypothetical protein